jgi:hypothetical protein
MLQQQQLAQKMATPMLGGWMVMEKWKLITTGSQRYTTAILPKKLSKQSVLSCSNCSSQKSENWF